MNTPTIPREELKEKLEERISRAEYRRNKAMLLAAESRDKGDDFNSNLCDLSAEFNADEIAVLRDCLTELERGEADTRRLDWLQKQNIFRGQKGTFSGSWSLGTIQHESWPGFCSEGQDTLRHAIDLAITTNQQEAE